MGSSRWLLKLHLHLHLSISTALMRPRRPKQYRLQLDIALWCKNQMEHSIWDESLLFSNCARSLEYSSSSTLEGLSYHICGKLEVAFKASPSSQHQHCTDEAQKAETVPSAVSYIYIYIAIPSGQYHSILPGWIANHDKGSGSSCPLLELNKDKYF